MAIKKICLICGVRFACDKFHPRRKVCPKSNCQKERQRKYFQHWLENNPDYFKNASKYSQTKRKWAKQNPEYWREYRRRNVELKKKHKEYMREYRRRKRLSA